MWFIFLYFKNNIFQRVKVLEIPTVVLGVKDQCCTVWLRFSPWSGNFYMLQVWKKKKKKKQKF